MTKEQVLNNDMWIPFCFGDAGDQAETFLGRFFRSSGIAGLSGMRVATLIRPGLFLFAEATASDKLTWVLA